MLDRDTLYNLKQILEIFYNQLLIKDQMEKGFNCMLSPMTIFLKQQLDAIIQHLNNEPRKTPWLKRVLRIKEKK